MRSPEIIFAGWTIKNCLPQPKTQLEETVLNLHFSWERQVHFSSVVAIVNAISDAAGQISAAISGGNQHNSQKLSKSLYSLRDLLFPELAEGKQEAAEKAKKIMEKVHEEGTIKVTPVGSNGGLRRRGNR